VALGVVFGVETVLYIYHYFCAVRFKVILEAAEEGGYVTYVPSLPGCVSQGETREEAVENIKEAIEVYLDIDGAQIEAETCNKNAEVVEVIL
jgi:predicted RNase H-like HicB family nuclease